MRTDFRDKLRAVAKKSRQSVKASLRNVIAQAHKLRPYATKARETVRTWWLAYTSKLRAHAGNALENLKTRFSMLTVHARKLRLRAAQLFEAVHRGYRAGVAYIGKRSPRTAKAIEACETWLGQRDWRRLGRSALAVALVLGIGFAAIFPEAAGRY
jgi:hypothetical protein